jgi:nucleotide-binding universal stress UspA family protein
MAGLGEVTEEIVTAAIQERVALIILSRRKKNALARVFMPSVIETVSRSAPCPVLSLDPQAIRPAPAWRVPVFGEIAGSF